MLKRISFLILSVLLISSVCFASWDTEVRARLQDEYGDTLGTIFNFLNSHPLAVAIVDSTGEQITSFGSSTVDVTDRAARLLGIIYGDVGQLDQVDLTNSNPIYTAIVDANGDQITSFGGGTEYADGDARGTATGGLMMVDDGVHIQSAAGTDLGLLKIDLSGTAANATALSVIGTVTANAGTNLNTSLLALETGGNLASAVTALQIIDNFISGSRGLVTEDNSASIKTAVELIDDTVFVDDTATHSTGNTKGIGIMAVSVPTDTAMSANDIGMPAMSLDRRLLIDANMQQGDTDIGAGAPLQVSVANTGANATAVKINIASGGVASGAIASGAVASGAVASGAVASGAFASGSIATGAIVDAIADDAGFTITTSRTFPIGFMADETSTDSVNEGDVGIARMTLNRRIIISSENTDDAAWTASDKVATAGFVFDDASPDTVDEGDVGYARMSSRRGIYVEGQTAADVAIAGNPITVGARAGNATPTDMSAAGDVVNDWNTLEGAKVVTNPPGTMITGTTDCTNVSTGYRITASSTWVSNFKIQAAQANVGTITVGSSSTYASNYMQLRPGQMLDLGMIDISLLYFGSTYAGDDINYYYTN